MYSHSPLLSEALTLLSKLPLHGIVRQDGMESEASTTDEEEATTVWVLMGSKQYVTLCNRKPVQRSVQYDPFNIDDSFNCFVIVTIHNTVLTLYLWDLHLPTHPSGGAWLNQNKLKPTYLAEYKISIRCILAKSSQLTRICPLQQGNVKIRGALIVGVVLAGVDTPSRISWCIQLVSCLTPTVRSLLQFDQHLLPLPNEHPAISRILSISLSSPKIPLSVICTWISNTCLYSSSLVQ